MLNIIRGSVVSILSVLLAGSLGAQSLYKISMEEKVEHSTLIVEGKVIGQTSFWNPQHTMIYTSNKVEIYKIFKGDFTASIIEVLTVGGTVGTDNVTVSDLLDLSLQDAGIFFCYPNAVALRSPATGDILYDIYSSSQGFIKYDPVQLTANAPFVRLADIETGLYAKLVEQTGRQFRVINEFRLRPEGNPSPNRVLVVNITSFSPGTVNAGATLDPSTNLLTINGTGFGTASGSAAVLFDDANDGAGGSFIAVPFNDPLIVSWSATQIQVRVPSRAGTGSFIVRDDAGTTGSSPSNLEVNYSILTATLTSGSTVTKESNLMNTNGSGGYTILYSTNTTGGGVNIDAAVQKATFQRALNTLKEGVGYNVLEGGTTTNQVIANDGINTIMFDNTNTGQAPLASGVLAVCYSYNSMCLPVTTNQIQKTGFDIVIRNSGVSSGSASFTSGPCPPASSGLADIDLETVILHELGHSLNLGHINDSYQGSFVPNLNPGKLMNFAVVNSVKRTSLDYSANQGAIYAITPQGNTYGSCGLFANEMTPLAATTESKDECPVSFPTTAIPNNTVVAFDLVHATSNKNTDPQYTRLNCAGTGTGVTNTAFYAFKTASSGGGTLSLSVSGYSTTPAALASCTPVGPFTAATGVELALYAVSSCPAGQAFPAPIACRTFNGNGALSLISGLAANTTYLLVADGIENNKAVFSLTFGGSVLPVRFTSFTGKINPGNNQLNWSVEFTGPVAAIILERSSDGIQFSPVQVFSGNELTNNGQHFDTRPFAGKNYYRLMIRNSDGSTEYSKIILLVREEKIQITAFPNPVQDQLMLEVSAVDPGPYLFTIYNSMGQLIKTQITPIVPGRQVVQIGSKGLFSKGNYFITVADESGHKLKTISVTVQ